MTGTVLERSLTSVIGRLQKLRILRRQAACWLLLLIPAIAVTLWLPRQKGIVGPEVVVLLLTTLLGIFLARVFVKNPSRTEAARLIEQADPELNDAVITAVQVADRVGHPPSVLAAIAIQEADALAAQRDWSSAVPGRQIMKWTTLSFLSFAIMVSSVMAASRYGRDLMLPSADRSGAAEPERANPQITELVIEPGDTELELGSALTVVAKFPGVVPTHAALELLDSKNNIRQMSMTETVDSGVFAARMEEISGDGTYRVLYSQTEPRQGDNRKTEAGASKPLISPSFKVTTYQRPKLERVDAQVTPPAWAERPQQVLEDIMRLTVTEGSTVSLQLFLNKPVARAELRSKDGGAPLGLTPNPGDAKILETTLDLHETNAWIIDLIDADGRTPADEEQISIKVTRNEPPVLKVTFPGKDTNVSPLQEFLIEATASDDFGLLNFGVQYSLSGGTVTDIAVKPQSSAIDADFKVETGSPEETDSATSASNNQTTAAILNARIAHRIELEKLNAAPDDLVTYSFWASDLAADGTERRSYSDLMFAEVRRFEEIFRESQQAGEQQQQQQGQQEQQGSAVDGVLKLQKEIISATWNTIRTEAVSRRNGSFTENVETIAESQGQAIDQLEDAIAKLDGEPKMTQLAKRAMEEMTAARKKLEDVRDDTEGARLIDAMPAQQSAVQSLLKMRAAEIEVRQQQQGGGGGSGGNSASEQQLKQLELDNNRNRYESEKQAQQQQREQTQQQREQVQVLNRLKELARRQQMVNERLKQLESELRAATTENERQEIERELKRLREEQREMLRDVDELAERMEQATEPQNPETSKMKRQMQEARENVQQASQAMDAGRLAEAIAEGTRAKRQFEDLKEDFRNQTSSKFNEAVRDLRDQANELAARQEKLAQQLNGDTTDDQKNKKPSLKSERNRDDLQKEFGEQRDRLNRVVEQTKQMVEQAEQTEPLLSNKLYDTLRELKDSRPEEALEATEFLAGRGMWSQSMEAEQAARRGINQLQKGIDKAADSVLGSEAESLRRAQSQLEDATKKLAGEVQAATGEVPEEPRRPGQRGTAAQKDGDREGAAESEQNSQPGAADSDSAQKGESQKSRRPAQGGQNSRAATKSGDESSEGTGDSKQAGSKESETGQPSSDAQSGESKNAPGASSEPGEKMSPGEQSESQSDGDQKGQSGEKKEGSVEQGKSGQSESQKGQARQGKRSSSSLMNGGRESNGGSIANNSAARPLTGDEFSEWSDQLRDIEEMLDDPELRNRVAQVRDRARAMRAEFKRHGAMPQWDLVKSQLLGEMQSLQQRLNQEVLKIESDRAMVPIDREPVPEEFDSLVQRYYELLGQERDPANATQRKQ